jgi:hypothetical protein
VGIQVFTNANVCPSYYYSRLVSTWYGIVIAVCSDFYVWTFAYDVSGIDSVTFHYRKDLDGVNPIHETSNEVYRSGELYNLLLTCKYYVVS